MSKPSILFIPGSFALPEFYAPVLDAVAAKGYEIRGLHLPSVGLSTLQGREGAPPSMTDDAAYIATEAEKLADEKKDVILVAHSYGGIPTTQSTKGLSTKERQQQGKSGGVVRIAYMTCLVPALGTSAAGLLADVPEEHQLHLKIDEQGWMYHDNPAATAAVVYSQLPSEEGTAWVRKFPKHSAISFAGELTHAGYKDIPVSYLVCEEDLCIPLKIQRAEIEMIEKESGGQKVDVTSIMADHCPNSSATQETIDWILDVAQKAEK